MMIPIKSENWSFGGSFGHIFEIYDKNMGVTENILKSPYKTSRNDENHPIGGLLIFLSILENEEVVLS